MRHIANIITGCRIICSVLLLFIPLFSVGFYVVYLLCGISDMVDGVVERQRVVVVSVQNLTVLQTLSLWWLFAVNCCLWSLFHNGFGCGL